MAAGVVDYSAAELFEKLCNDIKEARRLNDEESELDPETEPYRSKYKARALLQDVSRRLEQGLATQYPEADNESEKRLRSLEALVLARIGANFIDCEENSSGEEYLLRAQRLLESRHLETDTALVELYVLNQLGILWASRRQNDKALEYLKKAETLYHDYQLSRSTAPLSFDDLVNPELGEGSAQQNERTSVFESARTHTLYYLAQVYGNMGDAATSARYCHTTLLRQLDTDQYVAPEWCLSAATLSQYYLSVGEFTLSRHCMAAAEYVFMRVVLDGGPPPVAQSPVDEEGSLANKYADLKRCWTKYGLALLEASKYRLLDESSSASGGRWRFADSPEDEQRHKALMFNLELTPYEEIITDQPVLDFEQARKVFLQVQKWIAEASRFYVLDGYCSDHIQLVQDHSRCYEHLAFFEGDPERQCRMHKRRVDMLAHIADELSQQHYLLVWRQLVYELAEAYSAMVDAKVTATNSRQQPPPPSAADKVNRLALAAIGRYGDYVSSLAEAPPGTPLSGRVLPPRFGASDERPALVAWFCVGRLHSRLTDGGDMVARLANTKASYDHYKLLVDYCEQNPDAAKVVVSELSICREMVGLLPAKMDKLRTAIEQRPTS